jgi:hypothetical protein
MSTTNKRVPTFIALSVTALALLFIASSDNAVAASTGTTGGTSASTVKVNATTKYSLSFADTFPFASALCWRSQNGSLGARLKTQTQAVLSDCTDLRTTFTDAQVHARAQVSTLRADARADALAVGRAFASDRQEYVNALTSARSDLKAALASARAEHSRTLAQSARAAFAAAVHSASTTYLSALTSERVLFGEQLLALRTQAHAVRSQYVSTIQTARKTFWTAVATLRDH